MIELRNPRIAVPVVLLAGLIWSFGPLVVRYMNDPQLIPWQYIFGRGLTIFILLNLYLFFEEGKNFYKNYFKIGLSGLIGGSGLGVAMNIDIQTFKEIFSFKNKKASKAVKNGIAAKQSKVIAALVFVIENIKDIIAIPRPEPPIKPETPILK